MELVVLLRGFLDDEGRLVSFPVKRRKQLPALCYLASKFEAGHDYTEHEVNELLGRWHSFGDPATLRRFLYDFRLLDRERDGSAYRLAQPLPTLEELMVRFCQ